MTGERFDAETARIGYASSCREQLKVPLIDLEKAASALVRAISRPRQDVPADAYPPGKVVQVLADHELLSLFAWTQGSDDGADMVVNTEVSHRAAEHRQLGRRFGALAGEPDLVVLAERVQS